MASRREEIDYCLAAAGSLHAPGALLEHQRALSASGRPVTRVGIRTVDGVRIRCAESPGPREHTILLTSPWPESIYAFAPIWPTLAGRFRLFAIDLPGFGASERRENLLSPRAMGAFLVRVIEECGLERPHIVGPDVGTSAALFAAAEAPASVASVMVGCGGAAVPLELGEPLRSWVLDPDLDAYREIDGAAIVDAALGTVEGYDFPPMIHADYLQSYAGDGFVESMRYARRYPFELPLLAELLDQIDTPVLVFAGARDEVVPLANAEFLAARLPRSQLATIGAGHFLWEEQPDAFATMIASWVSEGHHELAHAASPPGPVTSDLTGASHFASSESAGTATEWRSA